MLSISQADLEIIRIAKNELLLGIITKDEEVALTVADSVRIPGHREWLRRAAIPDRDVVGAFSVHVKNGQIRWLYPNSALNPADNGLLRDDLRVQVLALLPLAPDLEELRG